ncbi:MAG: family 10 glycosylhydrolase [Armatimonadetes bacterium]|nr:family 10 glycosylhydrolase [Armatimonadota bacterium]
MMKKLVLSLLIAFVALPSVSQVVVLRDDRWTENQWFVNRRVENVERWLRRMRIPYLRVNVSALTDGAKGLFVLPANRPDEQVISYLQNAYRVVVFAFAGNQTHDWQEALDINSNDEIVRIDNWLLVLKPLSPDLSDSDKAKLLASWLFEGSTIPSTLQSLLQDRWQEWHQSLMQKRNRWLKEIASLPYRDEKRKQKALELLQKPLSQVSLTLTSDGTTWFNRLKELLDEHERLHKALAISLEPRDGEIRGVWLHTYAPTDWETVMKTIKEANLNCLFFRAGRGGNVVYRSQFLPRDQWAEQADLDELQNAVEAAKRYGIELHAWRVNHHFGTAPDWLKEQMAKEGRLVRDPEGRQALWLNPGDPRNQEHEFKAMMEMLNYPVAGVQFDYIRYPETPHYNFDYSEISRREFEKETGINLTDFPRQVLFGPLKIRYDDWQRENVTKLVRRVYNAIKKARPEVAVSAAVWQRHRYYYALIKQDWMLWVREGILDFVCPMDYTAENDVFYERVNEQVLEVNGQLPIAIGIGAYLHTDEWQFIEQVKIARDLGADGFVIFSYNIAPLKDFLSVLTLGATSKPTYPAYRSPKITFGLSGGFRLKDLPIVYRAGEKVRFHLSVSPGLLPANSLKEVRLKLQWERHEGFAEQVITETTLSGDRVKRGAIIIGEASVPKGKVRLVACGHIVYIENSTKPFIRRGPFVKGVNATKFQNLVQSLLPPKTTKRTRKPIIGVVAEGWGSDMFVKILKSEGFTAFPLQFLEPEYWEAADILVVPSLHDLRELTYQRALALRDWVAKGGDVLLLSEACGFRAHPNLFPEIAIALRERTVKEFSIDQKKFKFETRVLILQPQSGKVIGMANGDAIAVTGKLGKGRVVQCSVRIPTREESPEWRDWQNLILMLIKFLR